MATSTKTPRRRSARSSRDAEWKNFLLEALPDQGAWSDSDYLWLTDHTNRLVEFTDGCLEPLPMPSDRHQSITGALYCLFVSFLNLRGGKAQFMGIRLRIRPGKFREPDLVLVKDAADPRRQDRFWTGADLAVEVVSPDKPERDLVDKRHDYAEGKVPEYWIVNPMTETIAVLRLKKKSYVEHGTFRRGDAATSVVLPGFSVDVAALFDVN